MGRNQNVPFLQPIFWIQTLQTTQRTLMMILYSCQRVFRIFYTQRRKRQSTNRERQRARTEFDTKEIKRQIQFKHSTMAYLREV